jgi:hypothetical protein
MFSAVKLMAAAAIVALFGGFLLSGVLPPQQDEVVPPAAETASASPDFVYVAPQAVTGEMGMGDAIQDFQVPEITQEADRKVLRTEGYAMPIEMDDDRLTGTMYVLRNKDEIGEKYQYTDGATWTGTFEIVNDDGSWPGTLRGYTTVNPATLHWHMELTGTGAYDGLSALLEAVGLYGRWAVEGLVFPGALPEYPGPVVVPAE